MKPKRIHRFFAWYDFWIGVYYDRKARALYICPLPMCVFKISFDDEHDDSARCVCDSCGQPHDPKLVYGGEGEQEGAGE